MPPRNNVYITGATGRLGRKVIALIDAVPLVRSKSGLKNEVITDFSPEDLKRILGNAKTILHLAGSLDMQNENRMEEANVELTKKIVDASPGGCKIIFASSISVYGKKLGALPVDENTAPDPDSAYARTKYDAEQIVSRKPKHVILRIGTIYGKEFSDYFYVLKQVEERKMRIIGGGNNRVPFVNVDDVAKTIANSIDNGQGTYVIAGEPVTQKEVLEIAARELGVNPPTKRIGLKAALFVAKISQCINRLLGKKPKLTAEHIAILGYDRAFDCSKAKKELGFCNRPIKDGIMEIVEEYKKFVSI